MLHHATMDEPMNEINKTTTEPMNGMNEMTFASLDLDEVEDHDTSFVFMQDVQNVETQHGGRLPPVTRFTSKPKFQVIKILLPSTQEYC